MTPAALLGMLRAAAPLAPDRDVAREWAERELSDPAYEAAEPNLLDRIARAIVDFVNGLFSARLPDTWGPALAIVAGVVIVVLVVVALVIWGRPRSAARSRTAVVDPFDDSDERTAAELRRQAEAAASASSWDEAIVLRFRALARALVERTIVEVPAGTTVHGFARAAARAFPGEERRMDAAAAAFDDVRYLRRPGTQDVYRTIARLDDDLARARPLLATPA